jgi:hypothetical protein
MQNKEGSSIMFLLEIYSSYERHLSAWNLIFHPLSWDC